MDLLFNRPQDADVNDTNAQSVLSTAPIFTSDALSSVTDEASPQRALYGRIISQYASGIPEIPQAPELYVNTNTPFSALICGVQGSGKSHSTAVILEGCLMQGERIGSLPAPLSALVFYYDTAAGGGSIQPCEAAYLAALDDNYGEGFKAPEVTVLVMPNNLIPMRKVYAGLPSVNVQPLMFSPEDISGERLLTMMKVDEDAQMPLYMEAIMNILRSMEADFSYSRFRSELKRQKFNHSQTAMLNLRLALLDSCLEGGETTNRVTNYFKPGHLTIVDLSSAFMDSSSACGIFDIILGLFIETDSKSGKIVVLDEAHKYLTTRSQSSSSARLTESLLTIIRQQRHLGTRVVVSTQEPTVVPATFMDLCSFVIAHRFSSPAWLNVLGQHVSAAKNDATLQKLFTKIVSLKTGEAIIFAPNGVAASHRESHWWGSSGSGSGKVELLGQGYILAQSRLRVTRDGGHAVLAIANPKTTTRLGRAHDFVDPPSYKESLVTGSDTIMNPEKSEDSSWGSSSVMASSLSPASNNRDTASEDTNTITTTTPAADSAPVKPAPHVPQDAPNAEAAMPPQAPLQAAPNTSESSIIVSMTGERARFKPMVKYLQQQLALGHSQVTRVSLCFHFVVSEPLVYGTHPETIYKLIDEAENLGVFKVMGERIG